MYKDAEEILDMAINHWPKHFQECLDQNAAGIGSVLYFLTNQKEPVTAGTIARHMGVSTARVAVLLHNMEDKGYILRNKDPKDSRKTLISLSESGKSVYEENRIKICKIVTCVGEKMGEENLKEFIRLAIVLENSMEAVLKENPDMEDCLKFK